MAGINLEFSMANTAEVFKFPEQHCERRTEETMSSGGINLYRSIQSKPWYHNSEMVHLWTHLILAANHRDQYWVTDPQGNHVNLGKGQLMTGLRKLQEETGINKNKAERILGKFEAEGMIEQQISKAGRIITLPNYGVYQGKKRQKSGTPSGHQTGAPNGTPEKQPGKGFEGDKQTQSGTPSTAKNELNNKTIYKPSTDVEGSSEMRPSAFVQSQNGKKWGTETDLSLAKEIFSGVNQASGGDETEPNWASWANDIRLMRERDERKPEHISVLFKFANADDFWCSNILSPNKLRKHWKTLAIQCNKRKTEKQAPTGGELDWEDTSWADDLGEY